MNKLANLYFCSVRVVREVLFMYLEKTVAVIVPAYNEEKLIGKVLKTVPSFVDHIIVS